MGINLMGSIRTVGLAVAALLLVFGNSAPAQDSAYRALKVQGNVWVLAGPLGNVTVQAGDDGIVLVDTGLEAEAQGVSAAVKTIANKPVRWLINTSIDESRRGGNAVLPKMIFSAPGPGPRIVAHENVLNRLTAASSPRVAEAQLPNDEYFQPSKDFAFNGEAIVVYHMPGAHTDGDSIVHFRRSDVVSTGNIFTPGRYPVIDLERGGSVNGLIAALNRILQITVPLKYQEGGTYVIPGRGRICDEADVVEYRDMVTIVRDDIADYIKKGMTLAQVKDAKPTRGYDAEYALAGGPSPDAFVEAVYNSLKKNP